jgi:hypothetical protein
MALVVSEILIFILIGIMRRVIIIQDFIHQRVVGVIGLRRVCRRDMFFIIGIFLDARGDGIIDINGGDGDNKRRRSVYCCFPKQDFEVKDVSSL